MSGTTSQSRPPTGKPIASDANSCRYEFPAIRRSSPGRMPAQAWPRETPPEEFTNAIRSTVRGEFCRHGGTPMVGPSTDDAPLMRATDPPRRSELPATIALDTDAPATAEHTMASITPTTKRAVHRALMTPSEYRPARIDAPGAATTTETRLAGHSIAPPTSTPTAPHRQPSPGPPPNGGPAPEPGHRRSGQQQPTAGPQRARPSRPTTEDPPTPEQAAATGPTPSLRGTQHAGPPVPTPGQPTHATALMAHEPGTDRTRAPAPIRRSLARPRHGPRPEPEPS